MRWTDLVGGTVVKDFRRRLPFYKSDWTNGARYSYRCAEACSAMCQLAATLVNLCLYLCLRPSPLVLAACLVATKSRQLNLGPDSAFPGNIQDHGPRYLHILC